MSGKLDDDIIKQGEKLMEEIKVGPGLGIDSEQINSGEGFHPMHRPCYKNIDELRKSKLFRLNSDRITITPHVAGATIESQVKALTTVLDLCNKYLN